MIAMHELGLVFHVIDDVTEIGKENNLTEVSSVTLQVGEVSSIVPDYITDVWQWAVNRTELMKGCTLKLERIPAVTYCENCRKTYPTVEYGKTCPNCGSGNTYLVQGNEFAIKEIEAC